MNSRTRLFYPLYPGPEASLPDLILTFLLRNELYNKFLISYEFLVIFSTPVYLLYLIINIYQYLNEKSLLFKYLSLTWISLFGILIIYYIYLFSGLTESLWKREIWFSANDILHVLMILWIIYIWKFLSKHITDMKKY